MSQTAENGSTWPPLSYYLSASFWLSLDSPKKKKKSASVQSEIKLSKNATEAVVLRPRAMLSATTLGGGINLLHM